MRTRFFMNGLFIALICLGMTGIEEPKEILLWPNGAPGSEGKTGKEKVRVFEGDLVVSNIHQPSITPYLPSKEKATGAAVVIAPGGGHRELWITHEGYNEAKFFSDRGIAAFVLKYRLAKDSNSTYTIDETELGDMQRAIRLVRSRAKEWNINPERIGVMGFSAGGEIALLSSMRFDEGNPNETDPVERVHSRPNFQALVYPGGSNRFEVGKNAPPILLVGGFNDSADIAEGIAQVYLKYKKAGIPAELHIYSNARHGFGMRERNKDASAGWPSRFVEWLNDLGFLKK
jgi:endo-1,4-beta-xylanase